jgi:hypothetical protein
MLGDCDEKKGLTYWRSQAEDEDELLLRVEVTMMVSDLKDAVDWWLHKSAKELSCY